MTKTDSDLAPFLTLDGAQKTYDGRVALARTSLSVNVGESIAIVGPSGSGKTTLLNLMAGVIQPDEGEITLGGLRLSDLGPGGKLSALVGVIHQQFDLVPHLSALHNVLAGRLGEWSLIHSLSSLVWPKERQVAVQALECVGIPEKVDERAARLSGGEQQRVAIARLLVQDPQVIIADEPVSSLDPTRAMDILETLRDIAHERRKTLIASIHTLDLSSSYFDRVIGLRDGAVQFDLAIGDVTQQQLVSLYELENPVAELTISH